MTLKRVITDRVMGVITHVRPLTFGTYPSDNLQPGLGPVDPTSHSASHSDPGPVADTMVRIPHGSWRDDAARVVRSSLISTEVSLATSLYATWIVLTSQPTIPAACRRPSRLASKHPSPSPRSHLRGKGEGCGCRGAAGMAACESLKASSSPLLSIHWRHGGMPPGCSPPWVLAPQRPPEAAPGAASLPSPAAIPAMLFPRGSF
jgi:hypothetical protein